MDEPELTPEQNHAAREERDALRRAAIDAASHTGDWKDDIIRNQLAKNAQRAAQRKEQEKMPGPNGPNLGPQSIPNSMRPDELSKAIYEETVRQLGMPSKLYAPKVTIPSPTAQSQAVALTEALLVELKKLAAPPAQAPPRDGAGQFVPRGNAVDMSAGWEKLLPFLPEGITLRASWRDSVTKNIVLEMELSQRHLNEGFQLPKDPRDNIIVRLIEAGKILYHDCMTREESIPHGVVNDWQEAVELAVQSLFQDRKEPR